jgi:hypothetical protein
MDNAAADHAAPEPAESVAEGFPLPYSDGSFARVGLTCVICKNVYQDPYFARDGFTYCRLCIAVWEDSSTSQGGTDRWLSPRTNCRVPCPALLVPDAEMQLAVRAWQRQWVISCLGEEEEEGGCVARYLQLCAVRHSGAPVLTRQETLDVLVRVAALRGGEAVKGAESLLFHHLLGCCAHYDALGEFASLPLALTRRMLEVDAGTLGSGRAPFIKMSLVFRLLWAFEERVRCRVGSVRCLVRFVNVLALHVAWRLRRTDTVASARDDATRGTYYRDPWCEEANRHLVYVRTEDAAILSIPLRKSVEMGLEEDYVGAVLKVGNNRSVHYMFSESCRRIPDKRTAWKERRKGRARGGDASHVRGGDAPRDGRRERPVFPDYDPDLSESSGESSEADLAPADVPDVPEVDDSVFEKLPRFLPHNFYHSSVPAAPPASLLSDFAVHQRRISQSLLNALTETEMQEGACRGRPRGLEGASELQVKKRRRQ